MPYVLQRYKTALNLTNKFLSDHDKPQKAVVLKISSLRLPFSLPKGDIDTQA